MYILWNLLLRVLWSNKCENIVYRGVAEKGSQELEKLGEIHRGKGVESELLFNGITFRVRLEWRMSELCEPERTGRAWGVLATVNPPLPPLIGLSFILGPTVSAFPSYQY